MDKEYKITSEDFKFIDNSSMFWNDKHDAWDLGEITEDYLMIKYPGLFLKVE